MDCRKSDGMSLPWLRSKDCDFYTAGNFFVLLTLSIALSLSLASLISCLNLKCYLERLTWQGMEKVLEPIPWEQLEPQSNTRWERNFCQQLSEWPCFFRANLWDNSSPSYHDDCSLVRQLGEGNPDKPWSETEMIKIYSFKLLTLGLICDSTINNSSTCILCSSSLHLCRKSLQKFSGLMNNSHCFCFRIFSGR
jgi:hypothetical protein